MLWRVPQGAYAVLALEQIRGVAALVQAARAEGGQLGAADVPLPATRAKCVIADKASVIPSRSTNKQLLAYDRHFYQARHLIENFFARLKRYRATATRYDETARNFLGAIHLAAAVIWLD